MEALLTANPRSGGSTDPDEVVAWLRDAGATRLERCTLDELDADRVRAAGVQRVVVAGGDGSVGVAAAAALGAGVALAVVPTGTANDFARAADLPLDPQEAAALAVDPAAPLRPFELARMDGRPFLNVATAGLSVAAAEAAHPLKPRLGRLAYGVGALRAAIGAEHVEMTIRVDGEEVFDGPAWQVAVAATGHFGGGSATGGTDPADGQLDVVVVADPAKLSLVKRAIGMRRGELAEQEGVLTARGRAVDVRGADAFNVDGELCPCDGAAFTVERERVQVVVGQRDEAG